MTNRLALVSAGLVMAGTLAACGSSSKVAVHGTVLLSAGGLGGMNVAFDGNACSGQTGYDDLTAGASVVIKNADGTVIATTALSAGDDHGTQAGCIFSWATSVPKSAFYMVEVSHRGDVTYSLAQARAGELEANVGGTS